MPGMNSSAPAPRAHVLVVEDNAELRRLIVLTLRREYRVSEAVDAEQALAAMAQELPDALILDVMMPGAMDGLALCDHIKRSPDMQGVHVIFVTARGQEHDIAFGMAMGADAYFVKPFSPLALIRHLDGLACAHGEA